MTCVIYDPHPEKWDAFVRQHPQGHVLQLSAWGHLKYTSGWHTVRLAVGNSSASEQTLLAGAQMLLQYRYGVSIAYVPRGPLFAYDAAVDNLLLDAMIRLARRRRAVFLRCEPNVLAHTPQADTLHSWLLVRKFFLTEPIQPRSSIHLALDQPSEQIFASFSKGHRADIRRAERQGVTVQVGSRSDIDTFYAIMQSTAQRANFGIHSKDYYRCAYDAYGKRSLLLLAEKEGKIVAAHLVFADAHTGLYLYSGATDEGLKSGANHALQWKAIQWAHEQGCTIYDLWGIPDALGRAATCATTDEARQRLHTEAQSDPLIGVYRFKKGFGGTVVRYLPAYDYIYIPPLYALWHKRLR